MIHDMSGHWLAGRLDDSSAKAGRKHAPYRGAKRLIKMQLGRPFKNRL
jgi:hypothetical protein